MTGCVYLIIFQYQVSPLENAFDTLDTTNKKINKEVEHHISEPAANVQNLSMLLQGIIDASVNGGISNYKVDILYIIILYHI